MVNPFLGVGAYSAQRDRPGDGPGDHLVTIWLQWQAAISLLLSGTQGAGHSCWNKAWHRHSLARAACRSAQGV